MDLSSIKKHFIPEKILDIGANVGQFYTNCKLEFPNAYYYLIEGNKKCEVALEELNVDFTISLLSDKVKTVNFYTRTNEDRCTGNSIYREKTSFFNDDEITIESIETTTLNNLFQDESFDLIKIDVQGSEIDIINGGIDLIKKSRGLILEISLVEYNENSPTKEFVYEFLEKLGFYPIEHIGNINHPITHELIQQDILFINKKII
jgi:FkbM family methyltransferase